MLLISSTWIITRFGTPDDGGHFLSKNPWAGGGIAKDLIGIKMRWVCASSFSIRAEHIRGFKRLHIEKWNGLQSDENGRCTCTTESNCLRTCIVIYAFPCLAHHRIFPKHVRRTVYNFSKTRYTSCIIFQSMLDTPCIIFSKHVRHTLYNFSKAC